MEDSEPVECKTLLADWRRSWQADGRM